MPEPTPAADDVAEDERLNEAMGWYPETLDMREPAEECLCGHDLDSHQATVPHRCMYGVGWTRRPCRCTHIDGQEAGTAIPVCRCGHSWSDHSDHGDRCLVCDCPAAQYDGVDT